MAKAYVNKRDKFLWDNSFKPEDKIPVPSVSDEGKAIVVDDDGNYALDEIATEAVYFDVRLDTSDSTITVTDTEYTVAEINELARSYATVILRVQYNETNVYRLFRLYRVENNVTKWNDTVSTEEDGITTVYNDLINMQDSGTVTFLRRAIDNMHNYSTTERIVGTWIDGKPIYQKTWDFGSDISIQPDVWTDTTIVTADFNINAIINSEAHNSDGTAWKLLGTTIANSSYVRVLHNRSGNTLTIRYLTLYYTKTS